MTDILDSVLNLEEDYYTLGHTEGSLAGATAGRLEGRAFGIEKGFEKYLTLGIIKGRTKVWQSRTSPSLQSPSSSSSSLDPQKIIITNPRHLKHIELLQTLSTTPPIRNEEDDVEEVDDRIRRGKAKVKILENTLREGVPLDEDGEENEVEVERDGRTPKKLGSGVAISGATGLETEFEDFKIRRN
ncbi:hypothetical protein TWF192_006878 [Orbilia oligospora]|uniref:Essential protein Yae1 N-terminal domain-containing protein n=1 Tax=Orbilia oligospora TaxID=2813651 RepID=A0A6G1M6J3_ORBOL|nr:hypothetical protein TWF191_003697 [Orbilia oligospora]KAF3212730.1 hypothetical protein TWF679_005617 [Orbilia oligospora]KAF3246364.1 hypothetical protein TWF192_006878 [Orbilia oligospora]